MIEQLRNLLASILFSIATFISPTSLNSAPAPVDEISVTPTVITPTNVAVSQVPSPNPSPACQFNKAQMTELMKQYGYPDEDIEIFFKMKPGDCFNYKPRTDRQILQDLEMKVNMLDL